MITFDYKENCN